MILEAQYRISAGGIAAQRSGESSLLGSSPSAP